MDSYKRARNRIRDQVLLLFNRPVQPLVLPTSSTPHPSSPIDDPSNGPSKEKHHAHSQHQKGIIKPDPRQVPINMLPDEVLNEIFNFFLGDSHRRQHRWRTLVHVSQRWRYAVFASPRGLDLRFVYEGNSSTKILDVWPAARIELSRCGFGVRVVENWLAVLENGYHNRVCEINSWVRFGLLERMVLAMQKPFPELTNLKLHLMENRVLALPDSFLGGSAPRLRSLSWANISFRAIGRLPLAASGLVTLSLSFGSNCGAISPQAIVICLSRLTRLEIFFLSSKSRPSRRVPERRHLPPLARSVLPALTLLSFHGMCDYLEDLVAQIDCPLLNQLLVEFFTGGDLVFLELHQFICRAERLMVPNNACANFSNFPATFIMSHSRLEGGNNVKVRLKISCKQSNRQLSSIADLCSSTPLHVFTVAVEELDITGSGYSLYRNNNVTDSAQWLKLLAPFTSVKTLYLDQGVGQYVMNALQGLSRENATEVLPALQTISMSRLGISGPIEEAAKPFILARRLLGRPVDVLKTRW